MILDYRHRSHRIKPHHFHHHHFGASSLICLYSEKWRLINEIECSWVTRIPLTENIKLISLYVKESEWNYIHRPLTEQISTWYMVWSPKRKWPDLGTCLHFVIRINQNQVLFVKSLKRRLGVGPIQTLNWIETHFSLPRSFIVISAQKCKIRRSTSAPFRGRNMYLKRIYSNK